MSWQHIKTAPKTGEEVLVWTTQDEWVHTAVYNYRSEEWLESCDGKACYPDDGSCGEYQLAHETLFPTHWMPKPKGPSYRQEMNNPWIPVRDRLPAYDQWVEVTGPNESIMGYRIIDVVYLDRDTDNWLGVSLKPDDRWTPTHWRMRGDTPMIYPP